MPTCSQGYCGRSRVTGFWGARSTIVGARPLGVFSCWRVVCVRFPVRVWCRVSLSARLSRIVGARGVLRVFPGGLAAWRRIRGVLLCAWRTRFREVYAHLLPPVCGVGVGFLLECPQNCLIVRLCASPPTIFHGRGGALHPGGDSVTYE